MPAKDHKRLSLDVSEIRSDFARHQVLLAANAWAPVIPEMIVFARPGLPDVMAHPRDCLVMLAITSYFLRLNEDIRERVSANVAASLPPNFDARRTVGMPIRYVLYLNPALSDAYLQGF